MCDQRREYPTSTCLYNGLSCVSASGAPADLQAKELARPRTHEALIISSREPYGSPIVSKSGEPVEQGSLL
jgi:hypothetical protein